MWCVYIEISLQEENQANQFNVINSFPEKNPPFWIIKIYEITLVSNCTYTFIRILRYISRVSGRRLTVIYRWCNDSQIAHFYSTRSQLLQSPKMQECSVLRIRSNTRRMCCLLVDNFTSLPLSPSPFHDFPCVPPYRPHNMCQSRLTPSPAGPYISALYVLYEESRALPCLMRSRLVQRNGNEGWLAGLCS